MPDYQEKNDKGTINIYDYQTNDVIIDTVTAVTSAINEGNAYVSNDVASNVTGFKKLNQPYESVKKYFSMSKDADEEKQKSFKYIFKNIQNSTTSTSDDSKKIYIDLPELETNENYLALLSKINELWENEDVFSISVRIKSSTVGEDGGTKYCVNIIAPCTLIDMYDTGNNRGFNPNACFRFVGDDNMDGYVILQDSPHLNFYFTTEFMYNTFKPIASELFKSVSISFGINVL